MRILVTLSLLSFVACTKDVGPRREEQGASPAAPSPTAAAPAGTRSTPATPVVTGTITVGGDLASKVPANATLFITGRTGPGGPPALVKKVSAPSFPYEFVLTSDDVMMQGMPTPETLVLAARLDQDGDAISRSPGDLMGKVEAPVKSGSSGVQLVLSEVVQ